MIDKAILECLYKPSLKEEVSAWPNHWTISIGDAIDCAYGNSTANIMDKDAMDILKASATSVTRNDDGTTTYKFGAIKTEDKKETPMKKTEKTISTISIPKPTRFIYTPKTSAMLFEDGTRVEINCAEGTEPCAYDAYCILIAKKMFGSNVNLKKAMDEVLFLPKTKEEKKAEMKRRKEKAASRKAAQEQAAIERHARRIVMEKKAKELAKQMMAGEAV